MKALCFHWDESETLLADRRAQKRLLKQWTHTAKAFGVDTLIIICDGDPPVINDEEIKIELFPNYNDVREAYYSLEYVVITAVGLAFDEVKYPRQNVIFVVGSNYADPELMDGDIAVGIKGSIPLWDVVAAGIVLNKAQ